MQQHLPRTDTARQSDIATCRDLLCQGSRTFYTASLLLPRSVRDPATALYAFCRLADDAVDLGSGDAEVLEEFRERLLRIYQRRPMSHAVDRALADVVERFPIPHTLPDALLEGIAWDAEGRRYESLSELQAYAARVAGTVGAMMAILMGARAPDVVARACDLGVAMQLSNIARDVGEDARAGRIYLPLQWLREAGIDPDRWLAEPAFSPALGSVVQRLLRVADNLYARANLGIVRLPLACRPAIYAARYIYAEIGHELERSGLDSISHRTVVPGQRKLQLVLRSLAMTAISQRYRVAGPLEEVRFLVDAVAGAQAQQSPSVVFDSDEISWWKVGDQVGWMADLFVRLEQRDKTQRLGTVP